jgi:hypothetical protein
VSTFAQPHPRGHALRLARPRWLALALVGVAVGLIAVAVVGPLLSGLIEYRVSQTLRNQTVGLDAVSLFVVAPLAVASAVLVIRELVFGPVMALGIGAYTSYMFVQYILGPDYAHRAGNNERLFPLALFLFVCGWAVALAAWNALNPEELSLSLPPRRARLIGLYLLPILAFAAFARYLPQLADWMSSAPSDKSYLAGPTFSWTIALLDLGVFLPLTVATCIGLVRGRRWAAQALYTVVGWFSLVGPAVAAMAISMYVKGDPNASVANTAFMSALGLVFVCLAVFVYWPLFHRDRVETRT